MERLKIAYKNFIKNDLNACKKAAMIVGVIMTIPSAILCVMELVRSQNSPAWFLGTLTSIPLSYVVGYVMGITPAAILYYLVELVSPRQGKSYLPGEQPEDQNSGSLKT
jgi:Na+/citrate or Na+/malate symporter